MKNTFQIASILFILLLFGYLVGSTFYTNPIYIWDEAIYANNALEMSHTHNPFVMTIDYQPSLYNSKPPLGIWLMAFSIRLFGENEFAVRLPSVLAFLVVLFIVFRFSKKYFRSYSIGILSCIVLLSSNGLMLSHGVRSGDLDSLLMLSTTVLILGTFSLYAENNSGRTDFKKKLLQLTAVVLIGFFIKSTAIFLILPGLFISILLSENRNQILKQKWLYFLPVILLIIISLYYLLMHYLFPGYNRQVLFSEYKRVYSDIMAWHRESFGWYFKNLVNSRFTPFIYFVVPAAILGFISSDRIIRRFTLFAVVNAVSYLLIISAVPDKLEWYDLPVYPLFAMLIGIGIYEGIVRLTAKASGKYKIAFNLIAIAALSMFTVALHKKIKTTGVYHDFEREAYCVKYMRQHLPEIKNVTVLMEVANPLHSLSLDFYQKSYHSNLKISTVRFASEIIKGDTILISQENKLDSLKTKFKTVDTLFTFKYGKLIVVN